MCVSPLQAILHGIEGDAVRIIYIRVAAELSVAINNIIIIKSFTEKEINNYG